MSGTCLVSVARNRYSVPCELAGQMVSTRLYPSIVVFVADNAGVDRHDRAGPRTVAALPGAACTRRTRAAGAEVRVNWPLRGLSYPGSIRNN